MSNKTAFVTGATSGIGEAIARFLADDYRLIICGRNTEKLNSLHRELSKSTEVYMLTFDVSDRSSVMEAINSLTPDWQTIDVLINNAGNAHGMAPIHEGSMDDWDDMIDGNLKGLLYVTKAIVPQMVERKSGYIINMGSIAGKEVYPNGNVYCASKFGVEAVTQGLRQELNPYGIRVTAINPGLVETNFSKVRFKGDEDRAALVYADIQALTAEDVADTVKFVLDRPAHVNLADITMLPTAQASATIFNREPKL